MSERKKVAEFTRGVMDRIRDHIRKTDPAAIEAYDSATHEITGRMIRGQRQIISREIKK